LWDSEHLWLRVKETVHPGQSVLIVRGTDPQRLDEEANGSHVGLEGVGREYLSQQLKDKGLEVTYVVAYQRRAPLWSQAQQMQARALLNASSVWVFTSSQAARNLAEQLKPVDFSKARAIATHERIATELRHLGFGVVLLSRPGVAEVLRSLESLA
jgi:uroporphyrinogen-III synthase